MDITEYCNTAAYGTRVYLAKEKPENTPKARLLYQRLWFLDVSTKLLFTYWMAQKWLTYFNITIHWSQWRFRPNDVDYLVTIKKYILKFIIMKKNTNKEHLFRLFNYFYWNELLGSTELKKKLTIFCNGTRLFELKMNTSSSMNIAHSMICEMWLRTNR